VISDQSLATDYSSLITGLLVLLLIPFDLTKLWPVWWVVRVGSGCEGHAPDAGPGRHSAGNHKPDSAVATKTKREKATIMTKRAKATDPVYRVTEIVGTSTTSWEDAVKNAVETAGRTLRDLRVAEIGKLDAKIENGKIKMYRARVQLSFKYEG
jgi:dodecin